MVCNDADGQIRVKSWDIFAFLVSFGEVAMTLFLSFDRLTGFLPVRMFNYMTNMKRSG